MDLKIGPLTLLYWALGIVLTGALVFLGIMNWDEIKLPFFLFFTVPALFAMAGTKLGITRESIFAPIPFLAIIVSFIILVLNVMFLDVVFGYSITGYGVAVQVTGLDHILIAVLFAIYEETLFFATAALVLGSGIFPDWFALLMVDLVFVGLHALRYPATLYFDIFLVIGRTVMTGALLATKNSDVPFTVHILYNIYASLLGGS